MRKNRLFFFIVLVFAISCQQPASQNVSAVAAVGADTIQVKTTIKYARGFTIEYFDGYKLVRILDPGNPSADTVEYLLVQRGHPVPAGHLKAQVIRIPVQTIVVMSSMHVGMADYLNVADRITGLGSFQYINSPLVRENIKAGKVKEVGLDGNLSNELLISMHPDLLMTMRNPEAAASKYKVLTDAGLPVVMNAEWLETTPLGRAEWVKLMAAMVNKEALANEKFDGMVRSYDSLVQLAKKATYRPRVIIGMPFKGSWFLPAGDSYMSHFIQDAGGDYKWKDTKGNGSLALNFETVAPEALGADFWLNIGYVDSKQDILAKDARYASFKPFKEGKLYNNNLKTNDIGSNDYWESGAVYPDVVLSDMISILHPELSSSSDHKRVYYKQLQ